MYFFWDNFKALGSSMVANAWCILALFVNSRTDTLQLFNCCTKRLLTQSMSKLKLLSISWFWSYPVRLFFMEILSSIYLFWANIFLENQERLLFGKKTVVWQMKARVMPKACQYARRLPVSWVWVPQLFWFYAKVNQDLNHGFMYEKLYVWERWLWWGKKITTADFLLVITQD